MVTAFPRWPSAQERDIGRLISRDPFARSELRRNLVRTDLDTCSWCGMNGRGRLYRYSTHVDSISGRRYDHRGLFCSKSCHDSYHS